jgi:hypothetical protein
MSARPCPRCNRTLPEATLRSLPQGTSCPFCAAPLKSTPRRPPAREPVAPGTDRVQATPPPPAPQPPAPPPPKPAAKSTTQPATFPDDGGYALFDLVDQPPPQATPPLGVPLPAALPSPIFATQSRTRRWLLMGSGAALALGLALVLGLRPSGGAKANASVTPPPAPPPPETVQLEPVAPAAAPAEAPPQSAGGAGSKRAPGRRHVVPAKRMSAVAHHGKRHNRQDVRGAKPTRRAAVVATATKRNTASAPAERGDPRSPYERGNALLFAGDAAGAVAAYRQAVQAAPTDPIGYRGLGLAYEQKGDTAAAIRSLQKYLKLAPAAADRTIITRRIDRLSKSASR